MLSTKKKTKQNNRTSTQQQQQQQQQQSPAGLKSPRNELTAFALKTAGPTRGSDDHVKWRSRLQKET